MLFEQTRAVSVEPLAEGAAILRAFALEQAENILAEVAGIAQQAPFRHLTTRGGYTMSVAMTNCGRVGWVSDRTGYRYDAVDPDSGKPWPPIPALFLDLAKRAAAELGFADYEPDACLINKYVVGAKMGMHQDRDEDDQVAPIVSVSLGAPATFMWGGLQRTGPIRRIRLEHGDVVVWGGPARFVYHGVAPLKEGERINLTFRKVFRSLRIHGK